jgi:hypothetical protein
MKTRYGCLTLLGLSAVIVAVMQWTADSAEGGAQIALTGVLALALIYIGSALEWLTTRSKRKRNAP